MSGSDASNSMAGVLYLGSESRLSLPASDGSQAFSATVADTGSVLRWFVDRFADSDQSIAVVEGASVFQIMDERTASVPPGCEGLICLMHDRCSDSSGEAEWRGTWSGLTLHHGRYHLYRAILEGSSFEIRGLLEHAAGLGVRAERLNVEGPGARSRLWVQIHADVCGVVVESTFVAHPDPARREMYDDAYRRYSMERDRGYPAA